MQEEGQGGGEENGEGEERGGQNALTWGGQASFCF